SPVYATSKATQSLTRVAFHFEPTTRAEQPNPAHAPESEPSSYAAHGGAARPRSFIPRLKNRRISAFNQPGRNLRTGNESGEGRGEREDEQRAPETGIRLRGPESAKPVGLLLAWCRLRSRCLYRQIEPAPPFVP